MAGQQGRQDPKEAALAAARCLNPHPEQVTDPEFLGSGFFDARDAVQVKYEMVRRVHAGGAAVTEAAAAFGYSRPRTTRRPPRWNPQGWKGWCPPGPGRAAPASSPRRSSPGPSSSWPPAPRCARRSCRADRGGLRRARAPPLRRASAGPPPGAPLQKPLTCPPARCGRRRTRPCPCSLHLAPRLLNQAPARMPARTVPPAAGWTPATSNCVMPPCTHARARSRSGSAS